MMCVSYVPERKVHEVDQFLGRETLIVLALKLGTSSGDSSEPMMVAREARVLLATGRRQKHHGN